MKKTFLLLLLFISISCQQAFSQTLPEKLKEDWAEVVTNLNHRNELVSVLADHLAKAEFNNNAALKTMKANANNFHKHLDTLEYGKPALVIEVSKISAQLVQSIGEVMKGITHQPKIKENQDVRNLLLHLEYKERRIIESINAYNANCNIFKRTDLLYPREIL